MINDWKWATQWWSDVLRVYNERIDASLREDDPPLPERQVELRYDRALSDEEMAQLHDDPYKMRKPL